MLRENDGTMVITNLSSTATAAVRAPALEDGPLRGGFSGR
jgi:hypothetical protein